jgi:hypothetical protein
MAWFTTRKIMLLVAIVAVGLSADAMHRRRDGFLFRALQCRTIEQRAREERPRYEAQTRSWILSIRRHIAHWIEQAEVQGSPRLADRCRGLFYATERLIEANPGGPFRAADLVAYRDAVSRWTAGAIGDWKPQHFMGLQDELRPDSFGNLAQIVDDLARGATSTPRRTERYARLAEKYEHAASHPWESVAPDPPDSQ